MGASCEGWLASWLAIVTVLVRSWHPRLCLSFSPFEHMLALSVCCIVQTRPVRPAFLPYCRFCSSSLFHIILTATTTRVLSPSRLTPQLLLALPGNRPLSIIPFFSRKARTAAQQNIEQSQGQSVALPSHHSLLLLHCNSTCCPACEQSIAVGPHHITTTYQAFAQSTTIETLRRRTHVTYESIRASQPQRKPAVSQHQSRLRAR